MLQRLLLADARCCGGQESHFFVTFGRVLRDFDHKAALERRHGLACYWRRDRLVDELARLWRATVEEVITRVPDATTLVEKTPDHALWLDVIAEIVPASRVVHVIRDSRAVCASLLAAAREPWGAGWAPASVEAAIDVWRRHVEAAAASEAALRLHYEAICRDAVGALAPLWRFAGLETDDRALAAFARACAFDALQSGEGGPELTHTGDLDEAGDEPAGFYREGRVDGWRNTLGRGQQRRIWRETASLMRELGYDEDGFAATP